MTYFLWRRDQQAAIASNRRVLRAHEVPCYERASELCQQLDELIRAQPAQLDEQIEQARAEGFARGLEQGRAAARDEAASALVVMSESLAAAREQLRIDLSSLAIAVVRKLMGRFSDSERLAGLADTAAHEVVNGNDTHPALTLFVHPDQVAPVCERLGTVGHGMPVSQLEVRGDPNCAEQDCRLQSELGTVDATLERQLARLSQVWGKQAQASTGDSARGQHCEAVQ